MSSFDGGDTIHRVAGTAIALSLIFVLRWTVLALPVMSGTVISAFINHVVVRGFFHIIEVLMIVAALAIPTGVLNYIWQVYVTLVNGSGVSGYSDMDVLTFCVFSSAVCVFVASMHPISIFLESNDVASASTGSAQWWPFAWDYAQGKKDRVPGFFTVLSARTWSGASMAAFVALATSEWDNTRGRTAFILIAATVGWMAWLAGVTAIGSAADAFHKKASYLFCCCCEPDEASGGSTELDQVYGIHATAAAGMTAMVVYASSRMWDKFSWVETISGNKDDATSIISIGAALAGLYFVWAFFGQRILYLLASCTRRCRGYSLTNGR